MKSIEERAKELSVIDDDGWCVRDCNIESACIEIAHEVKKDMINKACEWWKFEMRTSCPDDVYESWCQHELEEFNKVMEE